MRCLLSCLEYPKYGMAAVILAADDLLNASTITIISIKFSFKILIFSIHEMGLFFLSFHILGRKEFFLFFVFNFIYLFRVGIPR